MSDITISGEYLGYKISSVSYQTGFCASSKIDDSLRSETLEKLKQKIDNIARKNFKRTKIIFESYLGILHGVVTSHVDDDHVWLSCDGSRTKQNKKVVYLNTPENLRKIKLLKEKRDKLEVFRKETQTELKKITETLECYEL